jgi:hypothetical protein
MGERLDRTQEVAGSSPASSISKRPAIAAFRFPQRMGSDRTYGENLVAIDARSDDRAQAVADLLAAWEAEDALTYEHPDWAIAGSLTSRIE